MKLSHVLLEFFFLVRTVSGNENRERVGAVTLIIITESRTMAEDASIPQNFDRVIEDNDQSVIDLSVSELNSHVGGPVHYLHYSKFCLSGVVPMRDTDTIIHKESYNKYI